ncbi:Fic family protein [Patescibacteria group bacterium]|nr:Fic family protein [Patescibacteria group bacterium]
MLNISQKLRFIQKLSELTQEKLAQRLGVSFATLNSWINGKSTPHPKAQVRIDLLYLELSDQREIPENVLAAKKELILNKGRKFKNITKRILGDSKLFDEFILALTYNSNKIEGSTLTESETADILFRNIALPNKDLIEQLEAKNHQTALLYLFKTIISLKKINENFIFKLHSILMNGIREDAGIYRNHGVRILGANVPTANYLKVPILMKDLVKEINSTQKDFIEQATIIHSKFEKIHPFSDGNGRTGRLLMVAMLLKKNSAPAVIQQEKRRLYYTYLQKSQQKEDFSSLENLVCDAILEGFRILGKI